ncbi:hypothetical protein ACN47A_25115 [Myxococcus fulvus]|uniref:hypothetical protein n=1 Tax=Myxococcus fulvus TaxID=33 RepID=UPI003B9D0216
MPVAQTPVTWLDGGAAALWSAECVAALIACGINPANFGTYKMRAKAQAAARKDYTDKRTKAAQQEGADKKAHEDDCPRGKNADSECRCFESEAALEEMGLENWMLANSQSGHISQNSFYQEHRGDPCSNVPPSGDHGGTYGYQEEEAFCMDHLGRSNNRGTEHYEVTNRESQHRSSIKKSGSPVNEDVILEGVKGTVAVTAQGAEARQKGNDPYADYDKKLGKLTNARQEKGQHNDEMKSRYAAYLTARQNGAALSDSSGSGEAGAPNSPSTRRPTPEEVDKAVECISDAWKQSLDEMRNDVINEYSTAARSDACKKEIEEYRKTLPEGTRDRKIAYTDLPADRRAKVDAAVKQDVDSTQNTLEATGAKSAGKANNPPTEDDCLTYQANWLQQHQKADGNFPPMKGRVAGAVETQSDGGTLGAENADVV